MRYLIKHLRSRVKLHDRQHNPQPLLKLYRVEDFGIDHYKFLQGTQPSFDTLEFDPYDSKKQRRRAIAKFLVTYSQKDKTPKIQRVSAGIYSSTDNSNADSFQVNLKARVFPEMNNSIVKAPEFQKLFNSLLQIIKKDCPQVQKLTVFLHQVRMIALPNQPYILPDGLHRDGVDYIVSAIVIKRSGVRGGKSIVRDQDKKILMQKTLREGESILQDDIKLLHEVTPVIATNDKIGTRDTLGFDFRIIEKGN